MVTLGSDALAAGRRRATPHWDWLGSTWGSCKWGLCVTCEDENSKGWDKEKQSLGSCSYTL